MAQKTQTPTRLEKADVGTTANSTAADTAEFTPERRRELATHLVDRFALWSGAAALIPVPVVDWLTVGGVQVQMLRRLSQIYGVPFAENRGKALIASLAGSLVPASSAIGVASALKVVPIIGMVISPFTMPALSAGATYGIGRAFIQHFESGGTLLDFSFPDYREFIKAEKEKWNLRSKGFASRPGSSDAADLATGASASSS